MRRPTLVSAAMAPASVMSTGVASAEPLCGDHYCFQRSTQSVSDYRDRLPSPNQLNGYQDRLDAINTLRSPYGDTVEPVFPDSNFYES